MPASDQNTQIELPCRLSWGTDPRIELTGTAIEISATSIVIALAERDSRLWPAVGRKVTVEVAWFPIPDTDEFGREVPDLPRLGSSSDPVSRWRSDARLHPASWSVRRCKTYFPAAAQTHGERLDDVNAMKRVLDRQFGPPSRRRSQRGNSLVENGPDGAVDLFLFIGALDFGFYAHAAICTENAARVAALTVGSSSGAGVTQACDAARGEMESMRDYASFSAGCTAAPLLVTVGTGNVGGQETRIVTVTYTFTPPLTMPYVLTGPQQFSRTAEVPLYAE